MFYWIQNEEKKNISSKADPDVAVHCRPYLKHKTPVVVVWDSFVLTCLFIHICSLTSNNKIAPDIHFISAVLVGFEEDCCQMAAASAPLEM